MYKIYFLLVAYDLLYFINNIIFIEFFYSLTKMEIKKKRRKIKKKSWYYSLIFHYLWPDIMFLTFENDK